MTDQELLEAMSQMMDQKLEPIKKDIAELKEGMEEVRDATNYTAEWVEKLEKAFQNHVVAGERQHT